MAFRLIALLFLFQVGHSAELLDIQNLFEQELLDPEERCDFLLDYRAGLLQRLSHPDKQGTMESLALTSRENLKYLAIRTKETLQEVLADPQLYPTNRQEVLQRLGEVAVVTVLMHKAWQKAAEGASPESADMIFKRYAMKPPDPLPEDVDLGPTRTILQELSGPQSSLDQEKSLDFAPEIADLPIDIVKSTLELAAKAPRESWGVRDGEFIFLISNMGEKGRAAIRVSAPDSSGNTRITLYPILIILNERK